MFQRVRQNVLNIGNCNHFFILGLISQDSSKLNLSLDSIDCGQDDENVIELEPSLVPVQIACYVVINDDDIAHEDDEVYNLTILLLGADPIEIQSMTLTIVDDDGLSIDMLHSVAEIVCWTK